MAGMAVHRSPSSNGVRIERARRQTSRVEQELRLQAPQMPRTGPWRSTALGRRRFFRRVLLRQCSLLLRLDLAAARTTGGLESAQQVSRLETTGGEGGRAMLAELRSRRRGGRHVGGLQGQQALGEIGRLRYCFRGESVLSCG